MRIISFDTPVATGINSWLRRHSNDPHSSNA